jgi:hypothetical protein
MLLRLVSVYDLLLPLPVELLVQLAVVAAGLAVELVLLHTY